LFDFVDADLVETVRVPSRTEGEVVETKLPLTLEKPLTFCNLRE